MAFTDGGKRNVRTVRATDFPMMECVPRYALVTAQHEEIKMNTENTQGCLGMGAQIVSKSGTQDKRGEIFTIKLADSRQSYAAH
mgnify:FL=1